MQVPSNNDPQPKIVIIHDNLTFSPSAINLAWSTLYDKRCAHYQLIVSHSCDVNSNSMVLINKTKEDRIFLEPDVLSNLMYFNLTAYDKEDNQCKDLFLEAFRFNPGSKFYDNYNKIKN